jgi:hypothetical protein
MFKEARAAYTESRSFFDGNSFILKSALIQRAEAQLGAIFLILGFALQMWGNLHGGITAVEAGWINSIQRLAGIILVTSVIASICLKIIQWRAKIKFYRIIFTNKIDESMTLDCESAKLNRSALLFDLKRKTNESDLSLRARLEIHQKKLGTKYTYNAG